MYGKELASGVDGNGRTKVGQRVAARTLTGCPVVHAHVPSVSAKTAAFKTDRCM